MLPRVRPRPLLHALLSFGPLEPLARRIALLAGLGLVLRVRGRRRVPRRGPLVVASTHPGPADLSSLDAALGRRLSVVADDALLAIPVDLVEEGASRNPYFQEAVRNTQVVLFEAA